ncbi:MAG TPA: hypothetical protein VNZ93_19475, partial [Pseudorhodoplanes sp.]|nr:hypothetical protein [Pseudorhodoplanes sp.]
LDYVFLPLRNDRWLLAVDSAVLVPQNVIFGPNRFRAAGSFARLGDQSQRLRQFRQKPVDGPKRPKLPGLIELFLNLVADRAQRRSDVLKVRKIGDCLIDGHQRAIAIEPADLTLHIFTNGTERRQKVFAHRIGHDIPHNYEVQNIAMNSYGCNIRGTHSQIDSRSRRSLPRAKRFQALVSEGNGGR